MDEDLKLNSNKQLMIQELTTTDHVQWEDCSVKTQNDENLIVVMSNEAHIKPKQDTVHYLQVILNKFKNNFCAVIVLLSDAQFSRSEQLCFTFLDGGSSPKRHSVR